LIDAATAQAEQVWLWRTLAVTERTQIVQGWKDVVWLRFPPIKSITSVTVRKSDGTDVVIAPQYIALDAEMGIVRFTGAVPSCETVTIIYQAGYDEIPPQFKQGILLLVGHWYENREAVVLGSVPMEVPLAVSHLLLPYRAWGDS
jgi:uncharacterized phiE125 gp8 family phage protein